MYEIKFPSPEENINTNNFDSRYTYSLSQANANNTMFSQMVHKSSQKCENELFRLISNAFIIDSYHKLQEKLAIENWENEGGSIL